ncbi:MAG: hypothetical protein OXB84_01525, partial [Halobacteriovoraceae bacterium]|nr:hypothetical protein [Halobacteriovoraceae bacterium]
MDIAQWIINNKEWLFSGIGIAFVALIVKYLLPNFSFKNKKQAQSIIKENLKILFIDDQRFKVVDILIKAGWLSTKRIRDIQSLDGFEVIHTDVF